MKVMTTKSKNSESFYISKSFTNNEGKSTSTIIRKLGTLAQLSAQLGTDRDGVMAWAQEESKPKNIIMKRKNTPFLSPSIPSAFWTTISKDSFTAAISFFRSFTMN